MHSRTRVFIAAAVVAVFAALSAVALATSPHFKKGGTPTCAISGNGTTTVSAECTGTLAGLGSGDLSTPVTLTGFAVYQCQNGGGRTAPGQNKVLIGPTTTPTVTPASAIKNGNVTFDTNNPAVPSLTAGATASAADAGCPNGNWTGVNPVLTLTDISQTISQPPGPELFTCFASNPAGFDALNTIAALLGSLC